MFVVGIAGGSGSGKTTVVERLVRAVGAGHVTLLPHDAYYLGAADMPAALRREGNWDHPDALDNRLYVRHIEELRAGRPVARPVYDFAAHDRRAETLTAAPRPILLLEGILLLAVPEVCDLIDLRVFVDTPDDLRALRRVRRDVSERGRTVESVEDQYVRSVRPMYRAFIEPSRSRAHVVLPWEFDNDAGVAVLAARLRLPDTGRVATM